MSAAGLPVRVQLENNGAVIDGRVEVVLPRPNGGQVTYRYPINLPTQSRKEITLYLSPQQYTSRLQVAVIDQAEQTIAHQELPLKSADTTDRLFGVIADQASAFNALMEIDLPEGTTIRQAVNAMVERCPALRPHWLDESGELHAHVHVVWGPCAVLAR